MSCNTRAQQLRDAWPFGDNIQPFVHSRYRRKSWRSLPPFRGSWVPIQNNVTWAETYLYTKWHLDLSSRLATIDMGRKVRGLLCRPLFAGGEELGPHLTQCFLCFIQFISPQSETVWNKQYVPNKHNTWTEWPMQGHTAYAWPTLWKTTQCSEEIMHSMR